MGSGAGEADIITSASTGINWGGTDVPMAAADIAKNCSANCPTISKFVQVPIALGGEGITYNVPGLKSGLHLNAVILADIDNGKIKKWNATQIKKLNPKFKLPNATIIPVFRSDSSGTSYIFTNFLFVATKSTLSAGAWPYAPTKNEINTYAHTPAYGVAAAHSGGVAAAVANTKYSIGYVEYSYILLNKKLAGSVVDIQSGKGIYQAAVDGWHRGRRGTLPARQRGQLLYCLWQGKDGLPHRRVHLGGRLEGAERSVSFNNRLAVRDVTFDIPDKQVTALIGPSGSGKTTLLRASTGCTISRRVPRSLERSCSETPTSTRRTRIRR